MHAYDIAHMLGRGERAVRERADLEYARAVPAVRGPAHVVIVGRWPLRWRPSRRIASNQRLWCVVRLAAAHEFAQFRERHRYEGDQQGEDAIVQREVFQKVVGYAAQLEG